ncbi:MAG: TolC family protein [Ferruginibacter sp.]
MKKFFKILFLLPLSVTLADSVSAQSRELSLADALQIASTGNRNLQIRLLEERKAEEKIKETKSFLRPSVDLNSSYNVFAGRPVIYLRNDAASPKVNDVKYGGSFAFAGAVTASYPLLNHAVKSNVKLASINSAIQKQETKNTEEELALEISQLYLSIVYHKEERIQLEQSLLRNERALKDSRSLFLQGKNLKTDTLSNFISVQNLKAGISALDNTINVYTQQLKQLMGVEGAINFIFTDSIHTQSLESNYLISSSGFSVAMDNRKDVKIKSLQIEENKEQLQGIKASFKPQLALVAQYQVQSQADNFKFGEYRLPRSSYAGVQLNIPIYSGGRLKNKTAQSTLAIQQNELALAELKNRVQTELVTYSSNLREAYNQWEIQQQNVSAAEINYSMMNDRYRYGLGTRLELNDAELALTKAKLNNLQAVYTIKIFELQLKKAMGILQLN